MEYTRLPRTGLTQRRSPCLWQKACTLKNTNELQTQSQTKSQGLVFAARRRVVTDVPHRALPPMGFAQKSTNRKKSNRSIIYRKMFRRKILFASPYWPRHSEVHTPRFCCTRQITPCTRYKTQTTQASSRMCTHVSCMQRTLLSRRNEETLRLPKKPRKKRRDKH